MVLVKVGAACNKEEGPKSVLKERREMKKLGREEPVVVVVVEKEMIVPASVMMVSSYPA